MISKEEIIGITKNILSSENDKFQDSSIFLVNIKVSTDNKIMVDIDSFEGIKVSDCATLSKSIEEKLDRENEDFELLVSSAGLDKPFKVINQYKKNIGRNVELISIEGDKTTGELSEVFDTHIVIIPKRSKKSKNKEELKENLTFKFEHIKQVKVVVTF